ncbi:ParB N-terminal domain-containing protein [Corynebacterium phoceense]|uniref:ParB N-terminal domain-containing protein n=1 Tax=Corynebacterium phoceense TaxID=1686286 RepID=UPI0034CD29F5
MADVVRYQVMPPLSADEYQDLFEDIKENGVLVPILVDEDEVVIDGHHRSKIAAELGIPCPEEIITGKSEAEKRGMAFGLNLKRRHLNREQRRALIAESLKADPQLSNREHERRTGAHKNTIQSVREELESTGQIAQSSTRVSGDGRVRPASQPPRPEPEPEPEGTPEPTAASSGVAPGFEPGDLEELNTPRPSETHQPRAEAITSQFTSAISDLTRVANRFRRIADDKNFPRNKEKVAAMYRHDLNRLIGELQTIADEIN